ncbi:putative lipid II flippase FtsW [Paremcibacter congregatus]|uniref:Probable peptidoglycan glycosyltransferase FtsW n=1 Tax=Paremcibacter congregatus TaxID=2043170 RepID=A0A2G4YTH6_9PROT|nr:putative lipid II flippase FtsW [Paremcibacter congregatus]PHZ85597.1 putative lipid II flippase FtsW [Paremcibacter congregatus]QDE26555.1 putative lipid II flippase FtsW [Paremcibacter congregatus]|tara:strand:- start:7994 stop:9142 length:1149 start_codon:yes stop_codon:yes gene_type:complete
MTVFSRTDTSLLSNWWWTVDRRMLMMLGLLIGLGILMTLSASPAIAEKLGLDPFHFVKRQMFFICLGGVMMFSISLLPIIWIRRLGVGLFLISLVLLALTMAIAPEAKGARRWLRLGSFTLQASEFLKPAFIVFTAWMFAETQKTPGFKGWTISLLSYGIVVFFLINQPDFGQTILITIVWGTQFFMAGLPMIWVMGLAGFGIAGILSAYLFLPHVTSRIDRFISPETGDTYQVDTAMNAFRSGGLFGRGPGEGAVKKILPDAHTDFIFAVTGEEFGIVLCLVLIVLFAVIVVRGLMRIMKESDLFIFLAVSGLMIQFGVQAFINLGVNLSLLPSKGMTLPFISYGGSSFLSTAIAMGMVLSLTRRGSRDNLENLNSAWRQI